MFVCLLEVKGVDPSAGLEMSSYILLTGGAPLLSLGAGTTGCGGDPPASKGDLISITPTEGPLIDRGCGVTGAGKSPIKNPGKNWALTPVFGDVGEPSIIGSDPSEGAWGSTANAAIATFALPQAGTFPVFKNGGNAPHR